MDMYNTPIAPIIVFVYNRPEHTRRTLEALSANLPADRSELFIFADGPKENASAEMLEKIAKVRTIAREKECCGKVEVIESDHNRGLAESIFSGVSEIVNRFGKVIVLEDDIVTSRGFLTYMNEAL